MGEKSFQLFPESASSIAGQVDGLYAYLVLVSAFFSLLIAFLIVFFAIKYRQRGDEVPAPMDEHSIGGMVLEIVWSVIPLGLSMVMFAWGASIFFTESRPPADSLEIYVTGKQWMWKIQHHRRRAGDQRTARSGESRYPADDDVGRRDPRFLRSGIPHQDRRAAGEVYHRMVPADAKSAPITFSAPSTAAPSTRA